jgi:hypothetical protein
MVGSIATKATTFDDIVRSRGAENIGHGFCATKG